MSIVVTTATGNVGFKVCRNFIDGDQEPVMLTRKRSKLREWSLEGQTVLQGSVDDEYYLLDATEGATALLWVTPPFIIANDYRDFQRRVGKLAAKAIRTHGIEHVVNVSAFGAHLTEGTGPVAGLHEVEELLNQAATNIVHLRCGWFFENFLFHSNPIRDAGKIFAPFTADTRIPMVATQDIADVATRLLTERNWQGQSVRGLLGPADLSFGEAAEAIGRALNKKVVHVPVTLEQALPGLLAAGYSDACARLMLEMYRAIEEGTLVSAETRTDDTPTTLEEFAGTDLKKNLETHYYYN